VALTLPAEQRAMALHGRGVRALPVVLAAATVGSQIVYPLVQGSVRDTVTVVSVVLFFAASVSHAVVWRGWRFAATLVAVTAGGGLLVEAAGVATGVPFGAYAYGDSLGTKVLGVPVVIPLAWTMMGYPALLVGTRIGQGRRWTPVAAGAALASWDLFLDPQMVNAGHWVWRGGSGPELLGIPVVNFGSWFLIATTMMAVLVRVPGSASWVVDSDQLAAMRVADRVPFALYLWTYASSVLAHAAFFGLPGSAVVGGLGMGIVVALFLRASRR
jgi:putative membrane protein